MSMEVLSQHSNERPHQVMANQEDSELYKALVGRRPTRPLISNVRYSSAPSNIGAHRISLHSYEPSRDLETITVEHSSTDRVGGYMLSIPDNEQNGPISRGSPGTVIYTSASEIPLEAPCIRRSSDDMRMEENLTFQPLGVESGHMVLEKRKGDETELMTFSEMDGVSLVQYQSPDNCSSLGSQLPNIVSHSSRSFEIGYEYESSGDQSPSCASEGDVDDRHPATLRRSYSDDGQYFVETTEVSAPCIPLDLSKKAVEPSDQPFPECEPVVQNHPSTVPANASTAPKMSLLQLADVASYFIKNDPQLSETFNSSSSSPSSSCDSNSSHSSLEMEEKEMMNDCASSSEDSNEYFTASPEASLDECLIKCEMADGFRPDEGIVLNSNVIGGNVYSTSGVHYYQQPQSDQFSEESASVCAGMDYSDEMDDRPCSAADSYIEGCVGNDGTSSLSGCVGTSGWSTSGSSDSKRRLRLAKAEYESMSEEDRRVRHRVLDNQRSKQYRERRRKMVNTLQSQIGNLEDNNKSLKDVYEKLNKRANLMRRTIARCCGEVPAFLPGSSNNSLLLKTEC